MINRPLITLVKYIQYFNSNQLELSRLLATTDNAIICLLSVVIDLRLHCYTLVYCVHT